ncbi:MAG: hypothetical protein VB086_09400 [Clostridiaceae bacterium]|nr:hypothetical protein [Clostridiaceae bacterium]
MRRFRISYPFLLVSALVLTLDAQGFFLLIWGAAMLHEAGHLAALRLMRCPVRKVTVTMTGLRIDYHPHGISYRQDAVAALAGPAANVVTAVLCAMLAHFFPLPPLFQFIGISLLLASLNLLPALPLDGGRALLSLLSLRLTPGHAMTVVRSVGLAAGCCLTAVGLWLLVKGGNFSLLICGILLLYENTLQEAPKTV